MCRFSAWVGEERPLSTLLYDAPHALEVQAYRPREMLSGHVNVDGTGVAWWHGGDPEPLRYVSERPPWSDANLPHLARRLRGAPILAAVRSQTPGMPAGEGAVHPFAHEHWAGAHNGYIQGFRQIGGELIGRIEPDLRGALDLVSDARVLFLLMVGAVRGGASLADALRHAAAAAVEVGERSGHAVSLNLVLADAGTVAALRLARGVAANTLYTIEGADGWPAGCAVASEPLDSDAAWLAVPDEHLVVLDSGGVRLERAAL